MKLLKLPLKLIVLPIALVVTVAKWAGIFMTSFAVAICCMLSCLCVVLGVLSYLMGIRTGSEAIEALVIGFVIFLLPVMASWLIEKVVLLNEMLWDFIKS
ncbi:MAG: CD1845 family protein [Clostridiales bacterium]|nr:CD1845 family protein [Clostridiales bacterium]